VGDSIGSALAVDAFAKHMMVAWQDAKEHLLAAQGHQKASADRSRTNVTFEVGQQVLLSTKNFTRKGGGSRKLIPRWIGPFVILGKVGEVSYRLDLPPTMRCHKVFHCGLLREYKQSGTVQPPPVPKLEDGQLVFEVELVLGHRMRRVGKGNRSEYLIKWAGYSADYNTWEPQENLSNCQGLVADYEEYAGKAP